MGQVYNMKEIHSENRISVLWTEKAEFPEGWGIKKHSHEYYHLFYIIEGSGSFIIDDREYKAEPDVCFIIPPGVFHELIKVENKTVVSYEVKFFINDKELEQHLDLTEISFKGDDFFKAILPNIVANGRSKDRYYIKNTDDFLCALLVYAADKDNYEEAPNSELIDTTEFNEATTKVVDFIEHSYMEHIYLEDIAEHVGYNRNYLCSMFKKDTGITINDYLNYVRIRKACEYISYSDIDINRICYRVGFTNASHFNRTFKKFVGMPPTAFSKLYPVDIDGNPIKGDQRSGIENQILTVADALGTLCHIKK